MNKFNYKRVVYFIGITIFVTIAMQVYWNYREYQVNKQILINTVQRSLDNSVEAYFANLTKSGFITYYANDSINPSAKPDTILVQTKSRFGFRKKIDSTLQNLIAKDTTRPILVKHGANNAAPFITSDKNFPKNIDSLISKVIISISRDSLDLEKLNTYIIPEFERNNIDVTYGLKFTYKRRNRNSDFIEKSSSLNLEQIPEKHLNAISKSTFLPHRSKLELFFTNETATLLKASLGGILLSFILSICIIASLIYLLKTIYKQKQLSEVKNDLISNITHEFKTPIATISTALEALKSFNAMNDKEKSEKYIGIANNQVGKLNIMVEKILETATLNQNNLQLTLKDENVAELIQNVVDKYKFINTTKTFIFNNKAPKIRLQLDKFHFENAIGNIIDNAVKYGGNEITIDLFLQKNFVQIVIKDNGMGIPKSEKEKVFDQFYRISTGNEHNVKGFGIGLYYTKNIIEKHKGKIEIVYDNNNFTTFKINLLND